MLSMQKCHPVLIKLQMSKHPCFNICTPIFVAAVMLAVASSSSSSFSTSVEFFFSGPLAFATTQRTLIGYTMLRQAENTLDWSRAGWMREFSVLKSLARRVYKSVINKNQPLDYSSIRTQSVRTNFRVMESLPALTLAWTRSPSDATQQDISRPAIKCTPVSADGGETTLFGDMFGETIPTAVWIRGIGGSSVAVSMKRRSGRPHQAVCCDASTVRSNEPSLFFVVVFFIFFFKLTSELENNYR